jgi:pyruvate/2-oxoglutarate dehydrogenase complex dihydrolipoamide dehydrogenase (E3) component
MERMRRLRAHISEDDSARRYRDDLGVDVFLGEARFSGPDTVTVGGKTLRFKKAVIATGARAASPPIPGLSDAGYLTNETVFSLTERPQRLAVIGGGPIGCELAQAFRRLGSDVVLINDTGHLLNREDADAAAIIQNAFVREGIALQLNAAIRRVERTPQGKVMTFVAGGREQTITVDEILVGAGRAPNVEDLNLEAAGIAYDTARGVTVNDQLQTTNPIVYAAGDICMAHKFTHAADAAARIVIQNALFFGRKKLSALTMPWCTYTDPEIAHVGMYEREAQERGIEVTTFVRPLNLVQRALMDGEEEGFVKVHVKKGTDTILGATIVARHAGEMINEISLAMVAGVGLGTIATVIHSYPTQAEAIKQIGDAYNRTRLTPFVKNLFTTYLRWVR